MFKQLIGWGIDRSQMRDLEDFLSRLKGMDSDELGLPGAHAYLWADHLLEQFGWDVFYPQVVIADDKMAILKLGNLTRSAQRQGGDARLAPAGGLVWMHTLRAAENQKLRMGAREIWYHLRRGFPYTQDAANRWGLGELLNVGLFPDGFSPEVR